MGTRYYNGKTNTHSLKYYEKNKDPTFNGLHEYWIFHLQITQNLAVLIFEKISLKSFILS